MLTDDIRESVTSNLVQEGWSTDQADKLVNSFDSCAELMRAAGSEGARTVTVPIGDFVSAVFAFGSVLGINITVDESEAAPLIIAE